VLPAIVQEWAGPYRTPELAERLAEAESQAYQEVGDAWAGHTERLSRRFAAYDRLTRLVVRRHRDTFAALDAYNADVARLRALGTRLRSEISEAVDTFDVELPERPEPEVPDDAGVLSGWLFDSDRSYLAQAVAYREHDDALDDGDGR
jgi:hypothetical protein